MTDSAMERCPTCGSPDRSMTRDPFVRDVVTYVPQGPYIKCPDPWHTSASVAQAEESDEVRFLRQIEWNIDQGTCRLRKLPNEAEESIGDVLDSIHSRIAVLTSCKHAVTREAFGDKALWCIECGIRLAESPAPLKGDAE